MSAYYTAFFLFLGFSLVLLAFAFNVIKQDEEREKQEKQNLNKTK